MPVRLGSLLLILSIAIALWQWLRTPAPRSRFFQVFGALIMAALATEIYGGLTNVRWINNNPVYNLFGFMETLLILWMATILRPAWKRLALVLGVGITLVYIADLIYLKFEPYLLIEAIILNSVMQSVVCMMVLWWLAQASEVPLVRVPAFWIFLGFLIYFAGILPLIGTHGAIDLLDRSVASKLYPIIQGACILRYLLAAYACSLVRGAAAHTDHG